MHLYLDRLTKLGYLLAVITMSFGPSLITRIVDRRNIVPRSTTSLLLRTWQTRIFPRRCSRPRLCLHFDMFSMKIGFAAFDQPGQLNRPFNYPIRYTYIYILASLESPRLEERTIGPNWLALHAMFHLLFNFVRTMDEAFVRTVTLFGSIPFYWRTSIHPLDPWNGTILQQTTSFFTISIVLNLIRFPVVRWKVIDARSILIFTTSLLVR